ncbi:MAG: TetR/AcrR family transcriptional regulator [Bacteroidales bacterium]|nr:TetR/AcrR family transcriptional regulator [Bacteroidales bacterium]
MEDIKQKIIETATSLYKKFGIKSVTMDDVARECMISKKTLYKYVNDKIDLLTEAFRYEFGIQSKRFEAITKKKLNAVEEVLEIHKNLINMLKTHNPSVEYDMHKYYPVVDKELKEKKSFSVYQMMLKNLKKGIKEGLYYNDIDIELIAKQRVILQVQKIENSIVSFKEFTKPHAMKQMFIYHLRAICSPKGIKLLNQKIKELD